MRSTEMIRSFIVLCALTMLQTSAQAQMSPEEHASHHPQQAPSPSAATGTMSGPGAMGNMGASPAPAGMARGGMMEGMGEMMKGMHGEPKKEVYPELMSLPELTPEKRDELQRAAHERMQSGAAIMSDSLGKLQNATAASDLKTMQEAVARLHEGMARYDSGIAAHRALIEGKAPRDVALQWFQREMNLLPREAPSHGMRWSWPHRITMALLIGFAAVMIGMYFFKMRRATALLQRLTAPPAGAVMPPTATPTPIPAAVASAAPAPIPQPGGTAAAQMEPPTRAWGGSLRVAAIFTETPTIKTYRLVNPAGGSIPFTFLPGQFLTLSVALAAQTVKRSYTIASSPAQRDYIEITVKREEQGVVSRFLHDRLHVGDLLQISAPQGYFTFTGAEAESIVLIGAGVGVTPLMSVIRALTDRGWAHDIYLFFACRTTDDFLFREELEHLQRRHPNLHVIATMTRAEGTVWMGPKGRLTKELLTSSVPELTRKRIHICGPPAMMDATIAMLLELGVPRDQIKTEAFGPTVKKETRQPAVQSAMVEAAPATTPTVSFTISGKAAPLPEDTSVLEAAEHVGVSIDNSCRAGTCGLCKVKLLKGAVTMEVEDALSADEKAQGIILACQAKSRTNLEVEA